MIKMYLVKSSSRRWPMDIFFCKIDSALINSHNLYKHACEEDISRRKFIYSACEELNDSMSCNAPEDEDVVSSEVEMNRTWTDNIILFQTLQLYTRLDIKHQIRFNKLD